MIDYCMFEGLRKGDGWIIEQLDIRLEREHLGVFSLNIWRWYLAFIEMTWLKWINREIKCEVYVPEARWGRLNRLIFKPSPSLHKNTFGLSLFIDSEYFHLSLRGTYLVGPSMPCLHKDPFWERKKMCSWLMKCKCKEWRKPFENANEG